MAALANAKHEAFARAIVEGRSGRDAYKGAGYRPSNDNTADACASRLLSTDKVAERVAELKDLAAEKVVMTRAQVLAELSHLGRANMADFVHVAASDNIVADAGALEREQAAAIAEVTVESYEQHDPESGEKGATRTVKKVKFKLHDKRGALSELRRHYEPLRHEHAGKDGKPIETKEVGELSPLEVARRIAFVLARATIAGGAMPGTDAAAEPAAPKEQSDG